MAELGHQVWIGDAAQIRAAYVRKQKTDKRDAAHVLKLLLEDRFPRIWFRIGMSAIYASYCCIAASW
jgi:transposase